MTNGNPRTGAVTYRALDLADAELVLGWRTRPDITRYMSTDIVPDLDRQRAWIERSAARSDFLHRLITVDGRPVGYCSITIVDRGAGIGTFGVYIAEPGYRTGNAGFNFIHLLNHAFFVLDLHKIVNHLMAANARLVRAQVLNGYRPVGILREHALKYGERHDLHIFEQLRSEWLVFREKFRDYRDLDGCQHPPLMVAAAP